MSSATISGSPDTILKVEGGDALVAANRSAEGSPFRWR